MSPFASSKILHRHTKSAEFCYEYRIFLGILVSFKKEHTKNPKVSRPHGFHHRLETLRAIPSEISEGSEEFDLASQWYLQGSLPCIAHYSSSELHEVDHIIH